ncbi:MAG: PaaI family thioesterase [Boseongicola sp.]|nr:PaaI family thioesterase [Boseongicola sp.]
MVEVFPHAARSYRLEELGSMTAKLRMVPTEDNLRPGGSVSGPTLFGLADCAMYYAVLAMIGPEVLAVTTSSSIDFMRKPAAGKDLIADVELLKMGRSLAVGDVKITSEGQDGVVARATLTYSIPPKR